MTKILVKDDERAKCPHFHQVRQVSFHDIQAKGPAYSRSLVHKVLGNEEFCLQMDAHTRLAPDWDALMTNEWKSIGNEFAVLSTIPPAITDMDTMLPTGSKATQVPRQCMVRFQENGVPVRDTMADAFFVFFIFELSHMDDLVFFLNRIMRVLMKRHLRLI